MKSGLNCGGRIAWALRNTSSSSCTTWNLTRVERGEVQNYLPGDTLEYHQNAKGFAKGSAWS